ncbi:hypothetical protein AB0J21_06315 [Streptomyces sp. NPDC049954]|uniref:hypothetical protein n=1 Tax=Streptomyces sp. NPDC049954 TaxID=3155779 RepID=UPI00341957C6
MLSPCGPQHAPAGDVGAALMLLDHRSKTIHADRTKADPEAEALIDQFIESLGPGGADDLLDGTCTLIYMFMTWLRKAHEDHDKDVIEYVVPTFVASMRMMPKSCPPEVIPTMTGMIVAAGIGLSPSLWRKQYGDWTKQEMNALEAATFLLSEHINRMTEDQDFAIRLITDALTRSESEED